MDSDNAAAQIPDDAEGFSYPATTSADVEASGTPWLSIGLIAILVMVFAAQERFAVGPAATALPGSIPSQVAMGALNRGLILQTGEWYRLFTAPFLHFNTVHLFANAFVLLLAGTAVERQVGRAWLAAIYFLSALSGSVASLYLQSINTTSIGASGAILGLVAASFMLAFRWPKGSVTRGRTMWRSLIYLVPALLPHNTAVGSPGIDYAGHFGGALTGGAIAVMLSAVWQRGMPQPPWRRFASAVALVGALVVLGSAGAVVMRYSRYQLEGSYIPPNEFPKTAAEKITAAPTLVAKYPNDPRSHVVYGLALYDAGDKVAAEGQFREVERLTQDVVLPPARGSNDVAHVMLLSILTDAGRVAEARSEAPFVCPVAAFQNLAPTLQTFLTKEHLCK